MIEERNVWIYVFFFKQKTAYEIRKGDWSSDVCSSDLELQRHYPLWSDDRVYHTARLIVSALIAKIHTVEWTPAILATPAIDMALKNNWYGPPAKDWTTKLGLWLLDAQASIGIPKTKPEHHGAPYCLTEDF